MTGSENRLTFTNLLSAEYVAAMMNIRAEPDAGFAYRESWIDDDTGELTKFVIFEPSRGLFLRVDDDLIVWDWAHHMTTTDQMDTDWSFGLAHGGEHSATVRKIRNRLLVRSGIPSIDTVTRD